ncbi:MAG: aminotransferase class V-fold PLP-dependent enzyme [Caldicoprobacterales bacterium]|jgi:cysteine desulfurase/selenocysteine lyase|nr:aminotransferase class V-fold PLP-dependent enzyme [Clostridiales bacterium]
MIYMDNAATTWPKPRSVIRAVVGCMEKYGANPGRSGHKMAVQAGQILLYTREMLCELFHLHDPFQIIFTYNCTDSLNLAIKGSVLPGDHVITTSMEHNAVIRPLKEMEKHGLELTIVQGSPEGCIDPDDIKAAIQPHTKLIVTSHASNVTGTVIPIEQIGKIARSCGIPYLVDAAQTAGVLPIDLSRLPVDMMAFPGHKGLLGPQGTGGLYIHPKIKLRSIREGGTGSQSESVFQPDMLPDKHESGTINTPGIAGLGAGVRQILKEGQSKITSHENRLGKLFIEALSHLKAIQVYGPGDQSKRTGIVSVNIGNKDSAEVANLLDERYDIAVRGGLHCAPLAHQTIGTLQQGSVRFSYGVFNRLDEVKSCIKALEEISRE